MNLGVTWKLPPGNLIACCSEWPPDRALGGDFDRNQQAMPWRARQYRLFSLP
jgi:hypothetical protein